jgi:transposase-like protein
MKKKARSYSVDFKQEAVRRMAQATTIIGLAKELGIRRKLLYQWRDQFRTGGRPGLERRRAVENQRQVYHRSHRPWKSLQDFHTPAAQRLLINKTKRNRPRCHQLIAVQFVAA